MDSIATDLLTQALDHAALDKIGVSDRSLSEKAVLNEYEQLVSKDFLLLGKWYYIAILDLMTCQDAVLEEEWIAKRLRIPVKDARDAIAALVKAGWLVKKEGGTWTKAKMRVRFPTRNSEETIRNFHHQMIQLATRELKKADADSFQSRLINGLTFAANPANLERAKDHLNRALYEVAEILTEGECTEVYQLNCQLFGLTRR